MTAAVMRGGTRWRRSALLFLPGMLVVALLAIGTLEGVLPLNLAVSGQDFKISSNGAAVNVPEGITLYPSQTTMKDGSKVGSLIAGLPVADLPHGMCVSLVLSFPILGTYTVQIHTSKSTVAKQMTLDSTSLSANSASLVPGTSDGKPPNADGSNVNNPVILGKDASELGGADSGPAGTFGITSPGPGTLAALRASANGAIIAGTAKLGGLSLNLHHGRGADHGECF